jgi:uncharacterized membrane protein HdeD (DUF308 family)
MENPYASPQDTSAAGQPEFGASRLVRHVGILAVLMMVQGAFELIMGVVLAAAGPLMFYGFQQAGAAPGGNVAPGAAMPGNAPLLFLVSYVALGLATMFVGALRIFTGIRNLKFRGRVLGMVSLSLGVVSMLSCYCAPTSIALFVYGLIVYLNSDVATAFEMAEQGVSPKEIKATFYG